MHRPVFTKRIMSNPLPQSLRDSSLGEGAVNSLPPRGRCRVAAEGVVFATSTNFASPSFLSFIQLSVS